jgi:hypothetical protein
VIAWRQRFRIVREGSSANTILIGLTRQSSHRVQFDVIAGDFSVEAQIWINRRPSRFVFGSIPNAEYERRLVMLARPACQIVISASDYIGGNGLAVSGAQPAFYVQWIKRGHGTNWHVCTEDMITGEKDAMATQIGGRKNLIFRCFTPFPLQLRGVWVLRGRDISPQNEPNTECGRLPKIG